MIKYWKKKHYLAGSFKNFCSLSNATALETVNTDGNILSLSELYVGGSIFSGNSNSMHVLTQALYNYILLYPVIKRILENVSSDFATAKWSGRPRNTRSGLVAVVFNQNPRSSESEGSANQSPSARSSHLLNTRSGFTRSDKT